MTNATEKLSLVTKLLGRGGAELIPLMNKGRGGIAALIEEAHRLGVVMSKETIEASAKFDDSWKRIGFTLEGLRNDIGGPLIDTFREVLDLVAKWVKENKALVSSTIIGFVKGLASAVKFLAGETAGAKALWFAFETFLSTKLIQTVMRMTAGMGTLSVASVGAAVKAAAAWTLAALPVVALGAAIALIADDLYVFSQGGDSVLGDMVKWFNSVDPSDSPLVKTFKEISAAIFDFGKPEAWDKIVNGINRLGDAIIRAALPKFAQNILRIRDIADSFVLGKLSGDGSSRSGGLLNSMIDSTKAVFSPAYTPNGPNQSNAPVTINYSAPMTVNAITNASTADIGDALSSHMDTHLREVQALFSKG